MRISDWSSDVCSSDLKGRPSQHPEYSPAMAKSAPASPRAASPRAVGIDFGTTNTVVAIADADGSVTPVRFSHADVVQEIFRSALCYEDVTGGGDRKSTRLNSSH